MLVCSCVCVCMCVCVYFWSSVRGVCSNYEVVEFQPRTVTPLKPFVRRLLLHIYYLPAPPYPPTLGCTSGGGQPIGTWSMSEL